MDNEFLELLNQYLKDNRCHAIEVYKVTEQIYYVLYYSNRQDSTMYWLFSFVAGKVEAMQLKKIKTF
jgi:hypothetical protein